MDFALPIPGNARSETAPCNFDLRTCYLVDHRKQTAQADSGPHRFNKHESSTPKPPQPSKYKILFEQAKIVATSPTLYSTFGHVLYQSITMPPLAFIQLYLGGVAIVNELAAKKEKSLEVGQLKDALNNKRMGEWQQFFSDFSDSPGVQRAAEGLFYMAGGLTLAFVGSHLIAAAFCTGALASLASAYYMNLDVNFWSDKQMPRLVSKFFEFTAVIPQPIKKLLLNPGFWGCVSETIVATQQMSLALLFSSNAAIFLAAIGGLCYASGIIQGLKFAFSDYSSPGKPKAFATTVAAAGNLSFAACNILLGNYVLGGALLTWSVGMFLLSNRIVATQKDKS